MRPPHSIRVAFDFFADRAYNLDGSLESRSLPGAVLHDGEAVAERGAPSCPPHPRVKLFKSHLCY